MAIAYDNASSVASIAGQGGFSWSHTIGSGSNRVLIVCFQTYIDITLPTMSVTYNDVALTQVGTVNYTTDDYCLAMYVLKEANMPGTPGAYTVQVSFTESCYYGGGGSTSWTGVDQTTAAHNFASVADASTVANVASLNVTSATGEVVVDLIRYQYTMDMTTNKTLRWERPDLSGTLVAHMGSSADGAATVTMGYTVDGGSDIGYRMIGASLKDAAAGGGPAMNLVYRSIHTA